MTTAIMFSKNRAAQCDLLLHSMRKYAPTLASKTTVLYAASTERYADGYLICRDTHRKVEFRPELDFQSDVRDLLVGEHVMFLCDDDIFYRRVPQPGPDVMLRRHPSILTFSLRLGKNTTDCYPLRRRQVVPRMNGSCDWSWMKGDGDFNYPGSLDGNVWRADQLRLMLRGGEWSSPNELEDHLNTQARKTLVPLMGCYAESVLVGCPINSVQTVYDENRNGENHPMPVRDLNDRYLKGDRLAVPHVPAGWVTAAHQELPLEWV